MNILRLQKILWCAVALFGLVIAVSADLPERDRFDVRVLLADADAKAAFSWTLYSDEGFMARDAEQGIAQELHAKSITISVKKGRIALNGRRLSGHSIELIPRSGETSYGDYRYAGTFIVSQRDERLYLVNKIDIEEYLCAVLRWEIYPCWPPESLEAMAIACRTYLLYNVIKSRGSSGDMERRPFDIRATIAHQAYKGLHEFDGLRRAVEATRGEVMVFNGKPIEAMYEACCGGVIPAHLEGVDFVRAPYLKRDYACTYCKACRDFSWKETFTLADLNEAICSYDDGAMPIIDLHISRKDRAGIVREVKIKTKTGWYRLSGRRINSMFGGVKSLCCTIKKQGKHIVMNGHGWGHHLGLCQRGAAAMAQEGWEHRDILTFYYPGASFTTIRVVTIPPAVQEEKGEEALTVEKGPEVSPQAAEKVEEKIEKIEAKQETVSRKSGLAHKRPVAHRERKHKK
ncbi:MAG: Sporulation stage II protein D [candidate division TM6 bacterium GW2011_GWE2_42_60]|nr:MAG: Sporulation stage II protein D [candidate division TM6 bacterium GW2011_GWE2_42_60]HBY05537.1 hypothetical protein [Candidatus Dependentiae bacterium]